MSAQDRSAVPLGGAMAWWIWILAVIFVVYLFSIQTGYAIVNAGMQKDVGLSVTQVGTIAATYTWVFAIFQFYGGAVLDALGSRKILPASIALVAIGAFVFANANSFEMLLLSQAILAIGSCTGFVGAGYIGGQWFGMAKFSFMFGLVQLVASLTSAVSQNAIDFALGHMDWRTLFNYVGIFGVVLFVIGAIYIRNPVPVPAGPHRGIVEFLSGVTRSLFEVGKIGHVWIAALIGAATFGVLLAMGVIWGPKLLAVRGASEATAVLGASMIWLGLAAGSAVIPWWSDRIRKRKFPILVGTIVQFVALAVLVYAPPLGGTIDLVLCFVFGFANASHMLTFSTAADVVEPAKIGTSAAVVNGIMFIVGGLMMARPGVRIDRAIERGMEPGTLELAQYAAVPFVVTMAVAVVLCFAMKETYPTAGNH